MTDRDKVISRLQIIRTWAEVGKNYDGIQGDGCLKNIVDWIDDALELLKKQEPRVLTLDEVKAYPTNEALWFEGKTIIPVLPDCRAEQRYEDQLGVEVIDTFYDFPLWFDSYNVAYKYGWRCWSARPTDEQREAVKWDD